jgi:hypothetical protein
MFRIAAAVLMLLLAGCGSDGSDETAAPDPVTVTETLTETAPADPGVECSTSSLRLTLPEPDLPAVVADVRRRVF